MDPSDHARAALEPMLSRHTDARLVVVIGEAMLTMQSEEHKTAIMREAFRLLAPGGRYGIHELCLRPDGLAADTCAAITRDLRLNIKVGARPVTVQRWIELLTEVGFEIEAVRRGEMHLLETRRVIDDEGIPGSLQFGLNLLRHRPARTRVLQMRRMCRSHRDHLGAVALVVRRPDAT